MLKKSFVLTLVLSIIFGSLAIAGTSFYIDTVYTLVPGETVLEVADQQVRKFEYKNSEDKDYEYVSTWFIVYNDVEQRDFQALIEDRITYVKDEGANEDTYVIYSHKEKRWWIDEDGIFQRYESWIVPPPEND